MNPDQSERFPFDLVILRCEEYLESQKDLLFNNYIRNVVNGQITKNFEENL